MYMIRHDFLETFDIKVIAGRGFSSEIATDTANAIMINETMARNLGWTNEEAIGKRITSDGNERVIGVFNDFHILSLHEPINNFILDMLRNPQAAAGLTTYIAVRVTNGQYQSALGNIEKVWNEMAPTRPFEFSFLDQELDNMYRNEKKFASFSVLLTILALLIACLGLIGLTSYLAEQRTKEIGVRRVMGATIAGIVRLLSGEFVYLILISNLIAWPAAYLFTSKWLKNFNESVGINLSLFIIAGVVTLLLALLITAYRAFMASSRNPAETLRYE
jgi:putative ABC transport system permease protein